MSYIEDQANKFWEEIQEVIVNQLILTLEQEIELTKLIKEFNDKAIEENNTLIKINDIDKYYLFLNNEWEEILYTELNQTMKVYQINGDYEMRGKR